MIKINLRIILKSYAYLQTMTKTLVKFQKIGIKLLEKLRTQGYPIYIHFDAIHASKMTKFKMQKMWRKSI